MDETRSRAAELRARDRSVLVWSLAIAALLHVAVFLFGPEFSVEATPFSDADVQTAGSAEAIALHVEVSFGPPEILEDDGRVSADSPDRQLEASHVLPLPPECAVLGEEGAGRPHGRVRLRVGASGRAAVVGLAETTGDECGDEVIAAVADALWYRWLPSERFPAPVDLIQPVTLVHARD